jgi:hypothetical protein
VVQVETREKVRFADDRRPDDQNETGDYRVQIRGYAHYDGRFFTRNLKEVVNFEHASFTGGAAGGRDRESENVFFIRTQLSF